MDIEKAKKKWKPMFEVAVKEHPEINEDNVAILCEEISNQPATFEYYYDKNNPDWELARLRLKKCPSLPLMFRICSELGIFDYKKVYKYYCEIVDKLPVEGFFSYKMNYKIIKKIIRKDKLNSLISQ